jgi:hypothetical protein
MNWLSPDDRALRCTEYNPGIGAPLVGIPTRIREDFIESQVEELKGTVERRGQGKMAGLSREDLAVGCRVEALNRSERALSAA